MEKVLDELKSEPDIIGAYVFHAGDGITAKSMPDDFTDNRLKAIAEKSVSTFSSSIKMFQDVSEVSLVYEKTIVTICNITDHHYLILLSIPNDQPIPLPMALQPVMNKLKNLIQNAGRENIIKPEKAGARLSESVNEDIPLPDSEPLIPPGSIATVLKELQVKLVKVIGPIAKIIFLDSVKEWMATDHPDLSTIPNLLDILSREINDPEKFNIYRKEIITRILDEHLIRKNSVWNRSKLQEEKTMAGQTGFVP